MATVRTFLPFLRPAPPPRAATVRFFFQQIQRNSTQAAAHEDPNLVASQTVSRQYPPRELKSQPRPKISRASHRTSQPTKDRNYPDKAPLKIVEPVAPLAESRRAPNLAYFVTRTPSNELPVYHFHKSGGNKPLTRIRKIDGNVDALRSAIQSHLRLKPEDCVVNGLTRQVIVRGHVKPEIEAFLTARNF